MTSRLAPRPFASGAARSLAVVALALGCGNAQETPFFERGAQASGGSAGTSRGGAAGVATGGSTSAGSTSTGGSSSGSAGAAGLGGAASGGASGFGGTGAAVGCGAADPLAVTFENHCYVLRTVPSTWAAAREDCSARGAHLVVIGSDGRNELQFEAENAFIAALAAGTDIWLGASDGLKSNQQGNGTPYSWTNGEILLYDRWASGEPNNGQSACMDNTSCSCGEACWEHCAVMVGGGAWNDRHCEHAVGYVCEWYRPPP
jgi:hypothetical protein